METFVTGLHIVLCLFLILVVLLQPGKGADFGAMMGGSTGQTGSAVQGATLIGKLTAVVAALFMLTSMSLAWFSNRPQESVISDETLQEELDEQEAPAEDEADPEGDEADPEGDEADPEGDEAAPGGDGAAPGGDEAAPGGDEAAPDGEEADPDGEEADPDGDEAAPDGEEVDPDGDEAAPE